MNYIEQAANDWWKSINQEDQKWLREDYLGESNFEPTLSEILIIYKREHQL